MSIIYLDENGKKVAPEQLILKKFSGMIDSYKNVTDLEGDEIVDVALEQHGAFELNDPLFIFNDEALERGCNYFKKDLPIIINVCAAAIDSLYDLDECLANEINYIINKIQYKLLKHLEQCS